MVFALGVSAQTARQAFDEGTLLAQAAQYEKALENYQKAIRLAENESIAGEFLARIRFNTGVCLYQLKRKVEAIKEFRAANVLSGGSYQKAFYALGMAETELKNWRKAAEALREAVRLKRADGEAWFDLGLVLVEEKNFAAAREAFQNSIRYKTVADADAHNNLGVIMALSGDFPSAEKEFETALAKSNGKSVEAQNNLQFCKMYKQNSVQTTKLEFSTNKGE
jgi:Flp pilus assembly protein TadD